MMSVSASTANVEPPPLLFGQRSPSPPSFSSPPQSPTHLHHAHTPVASPPHIPPHDVDMSTSSTLPPTGQNHDRQEDALMQDAEGLTNGHTESNSQIASNQEPLPPADDIAVEVAAVDEDAMDTDAAPDSSQAPVLPDGSIDPPEAVVPPSNADAQADAISDGQPPPPPADGEQAATTPPLEPPPPVDPSLEPPPPPPEPMTSDTDSSEDEDGQQPWHPIHEDTTEPDEAELKEIEAGVEVSALDHAHWEAKTFTPLEEPEYTAGATGRLEWTVEAYNGTKECPNRELVMKSEPITVGGHEWQIKFYPRGNDSDYLSVYVECLSVVDETSTKEGGNVDETKEDANMVIEETSKGTTPDEVKSKGDEMATEQSSEGAKPDEGSKVEETPEATEPKEPQHAPLPLLDSLSVPKRKSVAAQVSVVMYNPSEPRVNYTRSCLHRFCPLSPDWGWTRFHGPYYDIPHRTRGQRQALLRNDKLAFTAYIRVVEDETNCLWEHPSSANPWDSFAMTGLQSLTLTEGNTLGRSSSLPGGNLISTVSSWLLFKPFRNLLYSLNLSNPRREPFVRPKPLISALQNVLYRLRTQVQPGAGSVYLDSVLDALDWYGIQDRLEKVDVIEMWEILRHKIEDELQDTAYSGVMTDLFGIRRDYSLGSPSYRAPVVGVGSMQESIDKASDLLHPGQTLPQLLTIELERQDFDMASRSYVKLLNKVTLDEQITVRGTAYTLFGFINHRQTLQSYLYQPVLRPEGPGSKWYQYTDGRDENMVKCLTKRQATEDYEGKPGSGKITGHDTVAYVAMYVRDDVATAVFSLQNRTEQWETPEWLREEVKPQDAPQPPSSGTVPLQDASPASPVEETRPGKKSDSVPPEVREFQVYDSRLFLQHEGPGIFDVYDPQWQLRNSEFVHPMKIAASDNCDDIRNKLVALVGEVKDPRQIKFTFIKPQQSTYARPELLGTGQVEYSSGSTDPYADATKEWSIQNDPLAWSSYRIWVHKLDFESLPKPPEEAPKIQEPEPTPESVQQPQVDSPVAETQEAQSTPAPEVEAQSIPAPEAEAQSTLVPEMETESTLAPEMETPSTSAPEVDAQSTPAPDVAISDAAPVEALTEDTPMSEPEELAPPADTAMAEMEVEVAADVDPPVVDLVVASTPASGDTEMTDTNEVVPSATPQSVESSPEVPLAEAAPTEENAAANQDDPPAPPAPAPPPDEVYFFLKVFDREKQTLESRGSHTALKSSRVDNTVSAVLNLDLPTDKKIEMVKEVDLTTTQPLKNRRSFAQLNLETNPVIIVILPLSDQEQRDVLASRAAFTDIQSYLSFRSLARNFPHKLAGHFTYNYFSDQYYKGEIKNGHRHGHGKRIYHSGATYEGSFRLGQRHGHGLYTSQNGDTYDGDWVANQQHGNGTFVEAATGNTYVGGWKSDKKFGEGVTHWKNAQEMERLCRICWEESADSAFYDCGHVVACLACARQVQSCPVCRKRVLSAMKLYYVA